MPPKPRASEEPIFIPQPPKRGTKKERPGAPPKPKPVDPDPKKRPRKPDPKNKRHIAA